MARLARGSVGVSRSFHAYIPCIPCLLASPLWAMGIYIHGSHTHRSSCFLSFSTAPIEKTSQAQSSPPSPPAVTLDSHFFLPRFLLPPLPFTAPIRHFPSVASTEIVRDHLRSLLLSQQCGVPSFVSALVKDKRRTARTVSEEEGQVL